MHINMARESPFSKDLMLQVARTGKVESRRRHLVTLKVSDLDLGVLMPDQADIKLH